MSITPPLYKIIIFENRLWTTSVYDTLDYWCRTNCYGRYYFYPSWTKKIGAQFEDENDALLFALTWTNNQELEKTDSTDE